MRVALFCAPRTFAKAFVWLAVPLGLSACSDVPSPVSTDVSTRDIRIAIAVDGTTERTRITGTVLGPASTLRLAEGDQLVLVAGDSVSPLSLRGSELESSLPPYGGSVIVRLSRPVGRGGSLEAKTELAPPFRVKAPRVARAASAIAIEWDASAAATFATRIDFGGPCIATQSRALAFDTGRYELNPGELEKVGVEPRCTVTVVVAKRYAETSVQTDTTTFEISP
jgi:hypothetical protein